ncbi:Imm10 family immunity protein [Sorangium sp. So ce429]
MRKFKAKTLTAAEYIEINTFAIILAEQHDGSGMRLEIQKSLSLDDQDRQIGLDTYCLCAEEGATYYGGVVSWTLTEDSLEILLDAKAAEALGVEGGYVIGFAPESRTDLKAGLESALG